MKTLYAPGDNVLPLVFGGQLGADQESERLEFRDGKACNVVDAFALVNYFLCSAHMEEPSGKRTTKGAATKTMKQNCGEHFRSILEILAPTVIIVQGKKIWPLVKRCFDAVEQMEDELYRVRLNDSEAWLASFTHPAARRWKWNWGRSDKAPYLLNTVVPTIQSLRVHFLP